MLSEFIEIFGVEKIASLTADREFIGEEWFTWLKEFQILVKLLKNSFLRCGEIGVVE